MQDVCVKYFAIAAVWKTPTIATAHTTAEPAAEDGETVRIDQWLWSVRLVKTRSDAARACKGGHVEVNDRAAKPASPVRVGDRVVALLGGRERTVEVARLITKRVGAAIAVDCYVDHSPVAPPSERDPVADFAVRSPGSGRPTKRERRQLDRLRGRH